jgi:hypothetical protein
VAVVQSGMDVLRAMATSSGLSFSQAAVLSALADRLSAAGARSAPQLEELFKEGSLFVLESAFPDVFEQDEEIIDVLDEYVLKLPGLSSMEGRLNRCASTPRLSDAVSSILLGARAKALKRSASELASQQVGPGGVWTRSSLKARCVWGHGKGIASLAASDDALSAKWGGRALELLKLAGAPAYLESLEALDPQAAERGLLGSSRGATIRLRVKSWESFVRWLQWRRGSCWPENVIDLIDYVSEIMRESPTASFPRTFAASLGWFEARAGFQMGRKFTNNEQFRRVVERAKTDAGEAQGEVRRAPRFPVSLIAALEVAVVNEDCFPRGLRVVAWARLLKVFGVLRTDDLQRLRPANITMGEAGFVGKLLRTKCTGPGKKVRELVVFVPSGASVAGTKWLHVGYELWSKAVPEGLDFFLPRLSADMQYFVPKVATSSDLAGMFMKVLTLLRLPVEGDAGMVPGPVLMLEESMAVAWTGHSERASLPSLAATLGIPKSDRDYLGRWSPSGSDEYVRTYRSVMKKTMGILLCAVGGIESYRVLDEAEAYETAMAVMVRKGMSTVVSGKECELVKLRAKSVLDLLEDLAFENIPSPPPQVSGLLPEVPVIVDEQEVDEKEEKEAKYVVSVGRRNNRTRPVDCLHLREGCWRGRGLVFSSYELILVDPPPEGSYSMVCKTCWPTGRPVFEQADIPSDVSDGGGSTSTSSSSEG